VIVKGTLQNPDIFGRKWGYRADLTHIDGVLRVLAAGLDPDCVKTRKLSENGASGANFFALPSL